MAKPERILVVNPDPEACKHLVGILTGKGYTVGAVNSPEVAQGVLQTFLGISLVITVLQFGGVSLGILFLEWLQAMYPKTKIIAVTIMPNFLAKGVTVLRSPCTDEALLEAVQKELI